jgi:hypothetical protein
LGNEKSPLHSGVLVGLDEDSAHVHAGGFARQLDVIEAAAV